MLFSVVIPVFNRAGLLPATLETVRSQTFTDFEVIVVNDGSTDGTREYLRSIDWVRVVDQDQQGPGAARNAGVKQAHGDYVAFLDSDDLWSPWTLSTFAKVIAESRPAIVAGRYVDLPDERGLAAITDEPVRSRVFADYLSSSSQPISAGSNTIVIERSTYQRAGGFSERPINAEDHDLMLRLGEARGFAAVLAPITVRWRRHDSNITADIARTVAGVEHLIEQERAGRYPGGHRRAPERRRIITRHARPVTFHCLREGDLRSALRLFRATMAWNMSAGHFAYLGAFPLVTVSSAARRMLR
jgi:glycosyltransferase involved in cell wall biosynthesis